MWEVNANPNAVILLSRFHMKSVKWLQLLYRTSSGPYESEMICEQPERSFVNPNWKYFFKLPANLMTIFVQLSLCSQAIRTPSMFERSCSLNQSDYFSTHRNQSTKNVNCSFAVVFGRARSCSVVLGRVRWCSEVLGRVHVVIQSKQTYLNLKYTNDKKQLREV